MVVREHVVARPDEDNPVRPVGYGSPPVEQVALPPAKLSLGPRFGRGLAVEPGSEEDDRPASGGKLVLVQEMRQVTGGGDRAGGGFGADDPQLQV